MIDDIVTRLPKNVLKMDCGCLLYVMSPKNHGVTLHCKDHRTKAEIENDEEGLQETIWWQSSKIENLQALSGELLDALTEMVRQGMLPKITVRFRDAAQALEKVVRGEQER